MLSVSQKFSEFYLSSNGKEFLSVLDWTPGPRYALILFEKYDSIEKAEKLIGKTVYLHKSQFPQSEPGEFYVYQLLGLRPQEKGKFIEGYEVVSTMENPAHTILVFSDGKKEVLIPFIEKYVGEVSQSERMIEVKDWQDFLIDL